MNHLKGADLTKCPDKFNSNKAEVLPMPDPVFLWRTPKVTNDRAHK